MQSLRSFAVSLSARRRGLATLRVPFPFPLAAGPLQSTVIKELRGQEAAISFPSNPFRKRAFDGPPENEISIAFAMLTP